MNFNHPITPLLGRLLMSYIFVTSGIAKATDWSGNIAYMHSRSLPLIPALLAVATVVELAGSANCAGFPERNCGPRWNGDCESWKAQACRSGGELQAPQKLIGRFEDEFLDAPVQQFRDVELVFGRASDSVNRAELLELLAGLAEHAALE